MRITCAPDSFKESTSATQAAAVLTEGVRRVTPDAECTEVPVVDGGEDFTKSLADALSFSTVEVPVLDTYGRSTLARFALAEGLAVMEYAQAVGLEMVPPKQCRIHEASAFGVGQMILAAFDDGARGLLFDIGGSTTNGGGAGMLRALGVCFLDAEGRELSDSPVSLAKLDSVGVSGLGPCAAVATFKVACDVDNPLLGPRGSSAIYGPQKGVSPEDVAFLDGTLERLARTTGHLDSFAATPGVDAVGGLGCTFSMLLGGGLQSGVDFVVEAIGLAEAVKGADFALTGEGAMDRQMLMGKTLSGVARAAAGVPIVTFAEGLGEDVEELYGHGFVDLVPIVTGVTTLEKVPADERKALADAAGRTIGLLLAGAARNAGLL